MKPTCRSRMYSAQSIFALDLILHQAAHARQRTSTVGDRDGDHDLVRPGRVGDADLHAIEVASHVSCIFVTEWDVERYSGPSAFLRRRYERRALAEHLPNRSSQLRV